MAGSKTIGVLALQGAFIEHQQIINSLGHQSCQVRLPEDLQNIDALIIPGGESTAICKLAKDFALVQPLQEFAKNNPVWGTCAGLIFMAKGVDRLEYSLGLLDVDVQRNAFGAQLDSFILDQQLDFLEDSQKPFKSVYIRAPIIKAVGPEVQVLAEIPKGIVAVRQNKIFATCFHPELSQDSRVHEYFISMI